MEEMIYKQWFDGDGAFNAKKRVFFSQCNPNRNLSFYDLLKFSSDLAVEDYARRGMDRDTLTENGYAVLVSRVSYRIHRMPVENEDFLFRTWEEKSEPLQLVRAYEFTTPDGEKLISGISSWILANPVGHRIIPTKKFTMRPPVTLETEHDCLSYGKIHAEEAQDLQKIDSRVIRFSDLDCNGHTNNAKYGAFIFDALPAEYREKKFTDFRLNYALEAKFGQTLDLYASFAEKGKIVMLGKTEEGVSFECELYYE